MYKSAADSIRDTIRPNAKSAALIQAARSELADLTSPDGSKFKYYIALHIRRGDRKPSFYSKNKYVPTEDYVQAAIDSWTRLHPDESSENLFIYVASDSTAAHREVLDLTESRYTATSLFQSKNPELQVLASPSEYIQAEFNQLDEAARIQATRGVIVDFALVSGAWADEGDAVPEATVCTIRYDRPFDLYE